ncbi:MAG: hypothetical protein CSA26_05205 [Desulfobacterales bacterium]|nr:MAG: hypothetical protein CSA26_05205 [Desulfobacterales bacterium]
MNSNISVKPETGTSPLPYIYYTIPFYLLLIIGIIDSIYLGYSHFKNYSDITYSSFCALSKAINCDTVSQSRWSVFLNMPLSYWGFFGYLGFSFLVIKAGCNKNNRSIWSLTLLLSLLFSSISILLGYISATQIKSFCILCILSYLINFTLFFFSYLIRKRYPSTTSYVTDLKKSTKIIFENKRLPTAYIILATIWAVTYTTIPHYWEFQFPPITTAGLQTGITKEGNPWIGSEDAAIVIEEYSDYQCFQCSKMHYMLRQLISQHPEKIKLIHHHYPLDHEFNPVVVPQPYHVGAGKMALCAIHALYKNKFWETNDLLFELGKAGASFNTKILAEQTGLSSGEFAAALNNSNYRKLLSVDIRKGMQLRLTSTPAFVISGEVYIGSIPPALLNKVIQ